jgi:hypothetical protein
MDANRLMSSRLAAAFLVAAAVMLLAGLYLFAFAEQVATLPAADRGGNLWPWPIGPLAVRFVGALFISGALACYLVARRPDRPSVAAFSSVAAIASAMLLLHLVVSFGVINWSKPFSVVWLLVLLIGLALSIFLLVRARQGAPFTVPPLPSAPPVARYIAIFIAGLTGVVGGIMFFFPEFGRERWPWDLANTTNVQMLAAIFLTVCIGALLSWLQPSWYGYDLFYPAAGTFAAVALIASFMHWNLFAQKPLTSWIFLAVYVMGGIMGFYPYIRYALRPENRLQSQTQVQPQTS